MSYLFRQQYPERQLVESLLKSETTRVKSTNKSKHDECFHKLCYRNDSNYNKT